MLILTRRIGESIKKDDDIEVQCSVSVATRGASASPRRRVCRALHRGLRAHVTGRARKRNVDGV